ncbi:MAG: bifunctional 3-phosphoshikimate 1-carboxyvinyltransferase/cytidylate kinase [Burkholderiales bacterium]|nr:bifunctional 3-phosphoshikimate 1-carboxyvinyltransferase/cytidylate kinase [Burkholderiales bacterium]
MYSTEFLDLPPLARAAGTVRLPGSKSISNRLLLLAGLSAGRTELVDLLDSDDTRVMLAALAALGCEIEQVDGVTRVLGLGGRETTRVTDAEMFLGNAGTAMRPLTAALAMMATLQGGSYRLTGVKRMYERPIGDLVDALRALGCDIACTGQEGYPPLTLAGKAGGKLDLSTPVKVRGDVSSQFLTALLLALPLASAEQDVVVDVVGELISKPYVEITLRLLERFGVQVARDGWQRFTIPRGSVYRSPGRVYVEGDASTASYFIALGAIACTDAPLRIEGVGSTSIQGDIRFVDAARAMGAEVVEGPNWLEVKRGAPGVGWPLKAIDLDANHIPDAAMTLAVMALYATGRSRITNIASWRVKETDRIAAMAIELRKLGATVVEGADFIEIEPPQVWRDATIATYDDHRMAMCFSLAAFNELALTPAALGSAGVVVRILDPKCVAKTFPDYFETLFDVASTASGEVPVITIDGPTASGKGTLAAAVAERLGYHTLDSGSLYRVTALAAIRAGVSFADEAALAALARGLKLDFVGTQVWLDGVDVSDALRDEAVGAGASRVSVWPALRDALFDLQHSFARPPGLVADGRDMGTVIFPQARLKLFLTASPAARALRRHKQLIDKGFSANLDSLRVDLEARDERDRNRATAPLKPAEDALLLDNSALSIEASVATVLRHWAERGPFAATSA